MTRSPDSLDIPSMFPSPAAEAVLGSTTDTECARGTILIAFREATNDLWGAEGVRAIGERLPQVVREETLDVSAVIPLWVPESYVLAWYEALWHGPCEARRNSFDTFLGRMLDCGFGRVRKAFLAFAKPATILNKAPALWRHDHTHGTLCLESLEATSARVRLTDHPYASTSLSCIATAEIYRYCASLCRAKNVSELHYRDSAGALIVRLRWSL